MGDGTNCDNGCVGACCLPMGCQLLSQIECEDVFGGSFGGLGSTCANTCPGACCLPNGACIVVPETQCGFVGGTFMGAGTSCDQRMPNPCPAGPPGACCFEGGNCVVVDESECTISGGNFQGPNTVCTPNPCPQSPAPCCLVNGTCVMLTQNECAAAGGMNPGRPCGPGACNCAPPACPTIVTLVVPAQTYTSCCGCNVTIPARNIQLIRSTIPQTPNAWFGSLESSAYGDCRPCTPGQLCVPSCSTQHKNCPSVGYYCPPNRVVTNAHVTCSGGWQLGLTVSATCTSCGGRCCQCASQHWYVKYGGLCPNGAYSLEIEDTKVACFVFCGGIPSVSITE